MQQVKTPISSENTAYVAGLIDGEGYICGFVRKRDRSNHCGVRIGSTDRCLIEWLSETIGGGTCMGSKTPAGKPFYYWYVQSQPGCEALLTACMPHLVIKKAQAQALLDMIDHCRLKPRYDVPTALSSDKERKRRRDYREWWTARYAEMGRAVSAARYAYRT